ncbi:fumarylacetoacetate hydrolase family protein [Mycobacterium arosiense]|nr:fumarylacetoacetate hydrolase family protein [Mycobacterium arosiense]
MKLVSFGERGKEQPGVLSNQNMIIPLSAAMQRWGCPDATMNDVLRVLADVRTRIAELTVTGADAIPMDGVRLGPPVPHPGAVFAVGANYPAHLAEHGAAELPTKPILFAKPTSSITGPFDAIEIPHETAMLDYEIELAVVIGRAGRRISVNTALQHVAGYMIANDVTARDVFLGEADKNPLYLQVLRGKGYDTFCPTGPWLVTADEVGDPRNLRLRLSVNTDLRQDDVCAHMIFDVPTLLASVSEFVTLRPGDVVLTGSPAGVGMSRQPPEFLKAGDILQLEASGLGVMRTPVIDEPAVSVPEVTELTPGRE